MLELLRGRGVVAIVGRRSGQRLWDLRSAGTRRRTRVPLARRALLDEQRFRALGVRLVKASGIAHPEAMDRRSAPRHVPLPVRPPGPRPQAGRGALGLLLPARDVRAEGEARVRLLRAPVLRGDRIIGRIEPAYDRKTGVLHVKGVFAEPGAPASAGPGIARATRNLAKWLGAKDISYSRRVPRVWRETLHNR